MVDSMMSDVHHASFNLWFMISKDKAYAKYKRNSIRVSDTLWCAA